jgi:hypothetical protein
MQGVLIVNENKYRKTSWMLDHTLQVKGIPLGVDELTLRNNIQNYLTQSNVDGRVLSGYVVPNYADWLELEVERRKLIILKQYLLHNRPPLLMCQMCHPHDSRILSIIEQQELLQSGPTLSSGHGFFMVDSDEAHKHLLEKYTIGNAHQNLLRKCCNAASEGVSIITDLEGEVLPIIIKQAPHPEDILYINYGSSISRDIIIRLILNICVVLLLFFCTTPMSIFQYIGLQLNSGSLSNTILFQYVSTLLLSSLNSIILVIIELTVAKEKPSCRFNYQKNVYSRCIFYLTLNMLVIPALSFAAVTNIYQAIVEDANHILNMVKAVYFVIYIYIYIYHIYYSSIMASSFLLSYSLQLLQPSLLIC